MTYTNNSKRLPHYVSFDSKVVKNKSSNFSIDVLYDAYYDFIPNNNNNNEVSDFPVDTIRNYVCNLVYSQLGDNYIKNYNPLLNVHLKHKM